jgi:hypothetical protein
MGHDQSQVMSPVADQAISYTIVMNPGAESDGGATWTPPQWPLNVRIRLPDECPHGRTALDDLWGQAVSSGRFEDINEALAPCRKYTSLPDACRASMHGRTCYTPPRSSTGGLFWLRAHGTALGLPCTQEEQGGLGRRCQEAFTRCTSLAAKGEKEGPFEDAIAFLIMLCELLLESKNP